MSEIKQARKRKSISKASWPVIGFLTLVFAAIVGWVFAPALVDFLAGRIPNFSGNELPDNQMRAAFAFLIGVCVMSIYGLVMSFAVPKDPSKVTMKTMEKDQKAMRKAQEERKKRRQKLAMDMRKMDK